MTTTAQRLDQRFELVRRIAYLTEAGDILWTRYFPNSYSAEWNGQLLSYEALQDARPALQIVSGEAGMNAVIRSNESDEIRETLGQLDRCIRALVDGSPTTSAHRVATEPNPEEQAPYVESLLDL